MIRTTIVRKFGAKGIILSGGPESTTDAERAAGRRRRCSSSACRCSASATACRPWPQQLGGAIEAADAPRIRLRAGRSSSRHDALLDGLNDRSAGWPPRARRLDEPRRPRRRRCRRASSSSRAPIACPVAAMADEARALLRRAVPSRSHAHAQGRRCSRRFVRRHLRLRRRCGPPSNIIDDAIARVREQVGTRRGAPRPVRRRRFLGGRGAAAQGDRRPADLRVRRHGLLRLERRRPGDGDVRASTWASR